MVNPLPAAASEVVTDRRDICKGVPEVETPCNIQRRTKLVVTTIRPPQTAGFIRHVHTMTSFARFLGAVGATVLMSQTSAFAHGYLSDPPSRSLLCKGGGQVNCGPIQYEPQSLEGMSGFPGGGPPDGRIASAGLSQFSAMDEQTSSRWLKRDITAGTRNFTWTHTANHVTRNYRYYLTKAGWNPNAPLTRASFDTQPFCVIDGGMRQPPSTSVQQCNVPQRTGYQVILSVWEIGDTSNSFYSIADVMFQGGGNPPPDPVATFDIKGSINPSIDLQPGDKVMTRVFNAAGEQAALQTRLSIGSAADGQRNNWPFLLATRINAERPELRAGQRSGNGTIAPANGQNDIFARSDSGIQRVEIQIEKAPAPVNADLLVGALGTSYPIVNGQVSIDVGVTAVGEIDVTAFVYDAAGQSKGSASASLNNTGAQLRVALAGPAPGRHQLVVKGVVKGSGTVIQKTFDFTLVGGDPTNPNGPPPTGTQYVFPNGLASYKAGTLVLQPKTNRIYECKPWPYAGYCAQWNAGATQFEPGVGSNWRDAWLER
jgi:N-acetylglucosamine-binding protein A